MAYGSLQLVWPMLALMTFGALVLPMRAFLAYTLVVLVTALLLTRCTPAPDVGPAVDLQAVLAPDPLPQAPPPLPPPQIPPDGTFRAWVPRQVLPNGDTVEGHWLTLSTTPPALEVQEPPVPMPRAPRAVFTAPKPREHPAPRPPQPPPQPPPAPAYGYPTQTGPYGYGWTGTSVSPPRQPPAPMPFGEP